MDPDLGILQTGFDYVIFLGSSVLCIAGNRKLLAVSCQDRSLNCYKLATGARCLPPLLLDDAIVSLYLSDKNMCLILTSTGFLYLWDLEISKALLSRISIRSLLSNTGIY